MNQINLKESEIYKLIKTTHTFSNTVSAIFIGHSAIPWHGIVVPFILYVEFDLDDFA